MPLTKCTFHLLQRRTLAGLTICLTSFVIVACSNPSSSTSSTNALPFHADGPVPARGTPKPSPTPYNYSFTTVDDPGSTTYSKVLGIDDLDHAVGAFSTGNQGYPSNGFSTAVPYTKFVKMNYPGSISTVITSRFNRYMAGYFVDDTQGHHTWGLIKYRGIWSQYKDFHTPDGPNSVNELLGINNNGIAVGFFVDSYGNDQPYALAQRHYHPLSPPGAVSATATGINLRGDIVGTETLASGGGTVAWILRTGTYLQFSYPGSSSTEANAVNYQDQVVGSYVDDTGTHGYILTKPGSQQYWQTIDEPNAAGTTVLTSINSHHSISGWYVDANGNTNGFVADLAPGSK